MIGNTSFTGVITPEGFVGGEEGFVGIMAVSDSDMAVGIAAVERRLCGRGRRESSKAGYGEGW